MKTNRIRLLALAAAASVVLAAAPARAEPKTEPQTTWGARVAATLFYAGLVTATYLARHDESSRTVATVGGVYGGSMIGCLGTGAVVAHSIHDPDGMYAGCYLGILPGAVLGGVAAYLIAASPGARAPVTAVGFAPIPLWALTFD